MSRTIFIPFLMVLLVGVTSLGLATNTPTIELEAAVHFLTPGGEDVIVEQGEYEVGQASEWLHLTPVGGEKTDAILVEAQPIDHQEAIEVPTTFSRSEHEDEYVIILLLPDGTGLGALGSYSGVHTRGVILGSGFWKGIVLPTVTKVGAVRPGRTLTIQGTNFGIRGSVVLHLVNPKTKKFLLRIEKWGSRKISAKIPGNISGFIDHQAKIQVFNAKGVGGIAKKVPFYAVRQSIVLPQSNQAVKVKHCSTSANDNYCNKQKTTKGRSCSATFTKSVKDATIYVRHVNCDIVDKDSGTDRFTIALKNGWVFTRIVPFRYKKGESQTALERKMALMLMSSSAQKYLGTSYWESNMTWKIGPGPGQIELGYKVTIRGPRGVPFR